MKKVIGLVVSLALALLAIPIAVSAQAGVLDNVVISPVTANATIEGTLQFTAVARDADSVTVEGVSFTWSVVNGGGGIDEEGLFTAGNQTGTFTNTVNVIATQGDIIKSAFATVTVLAPVLDHVVISPARVTVRKGGTVQFTAIGRDSDNVTIKGVEFAWEVVNGGGTIDEEGLFTAGNVTGTFASTVKVTATADNITKTAFATATVTAARAKNPAGDLPPGFSRGEKKGWNGADAPPGWDNGNKAGWQGGDTPPGFSNGKKAGWGGGVTEGAGLPAPSNQGKGKGDQQAPMASPGGGHGKSEGKGNGNTRK
jgi:plastocyanin